MNWFRTILDGVAMSVVFNGVVAVFWLLKPHSFIVMFPKSLQKKARPVTRDERRHTILMYATLYPAVLVWMILSAYQADINGFWPLFWTAYVEMILISLGDLIFLDYLLLKKTGRFGCTGVSVAGAVTHNLAQIAAAAVLLETGALAWYLPVLVLTGTLAGVCIGVLAALCVRRIPE